MFSISQCNEPMTYRVRQMVGGGIPMVQLPVNTSPSEEQLQCGDPFFLLTHKTKFKWEQKIEFADYKTNKCSCLDNCMKEADAAMNIVISSIKIASSFSLYNYAF